MPKRIIDLPTAEWRARCLADANAIHELSLHLDMCREDGDPPEQMSVRRILLESQDCLRYFSRALKDRRELRAFLRKWIPRLEARMAAFDAVRATAGK